MRCELTLRRHERMTTVSRADSESWVSTCDPLTHDQLTDDYYYYYYYYYYARLINGLPGQPGSGTRKSTLFQFLRFPSSALSR